MHKHIIVTALIALAVTSCQKKASGQTVAVVNNQEITASELNAALAANHALGSADTKQARQEQLQALVNRALLVQQAKAQGIDKTPEYLNRLQTTTDNLLIDMLLTRAIKTSELPSAAEISSYEASHPQMFAKREIWTLSQITYALPQNASVIAKLQASKSLDEVAQILNSSAIQFTRNTRKIDTAALPSDAYEQVERLPAGMPFIVPGPTAAVANVITTKEPNPTPADQAQGIAVNAMQREKMAKMVQDRVKTLRATAKIEYQPGFAPSGKQ